MQLVVFVVGLRGNFRIFRIIFVLPLTPFRKIIETKVPDYKSCLTCKVSLTLHDCLNKVRQNDLFHLRLT